MQLNPSDLCQTSFTITTINMFGEIEVITPPDQKVINAAIKNLFHIVKEEGGGLEPKLLEKAVRWSYEKEHKEAILKRIELEMTRVNMWNICPGQYFLRPLQLEIISGMKWIESLIEDSFEEPESEDEKDELLNQLLKAGQVYISPNLHAMIDRLAEVDKLRGFDLINYRLCKANLNSEGDWFDEFEQAEAVISTLSTLKEREKGTKILIKFLFRHRYYVEAIKLCYRLEKELSKEDQFQYLSKAVFKQKWLERWFSSEELCKKINLEDFDRFMKEENPEFNYRLTGNAEKSYTACMKALDNPSCLMEQIKYKTSEDKIKILCKILKFLNDMNSGKR